MKNYRELLGDAEAHFNRVFDASRDQMQCGRGCSLCCYGLFEVSSSDVAVLVDALNAVDDATRADIIATAEETMRVTDHPNIREITDDARDEFFDRTASIPCPALDARGACRIYEHRPLVCRTFGLPLRNADEYIGDICDLNFKTADAETLMRASWDLQHEDVVETSDQYTIPEAILIANRLR